MCWGDVQLMKDADGTEYTLNENDIPPCRIMQLSGHKNEQSINN